MYDGAIDVHHHIVPEFYRDALAGGGVDSPIAGVEFPAWDVESSLALMEDQGIETAMVSLSVPGVSVPEAGLARRLARETNEFMAEMTRAYPGRFGAFAALPLPDVDAALIEMEYALDVLALDSVGLFTHYGRTYLGDESLEPVLAELARRGVTAFVHPAAPCGDAQPLVDLPASVCEFPFATTRMAAQMLYNGVFERHPDLRLILPHAGGTLPYLAERLTFAPVIRPSMADSAPSDPLALLRRQYYDTAMSGNPYTLPSLRAFVPPTQILVGTDYPFMPGWSSAECGRQLLEHGGFTDAEVADLVRGNAVRLFPRVARSGSSAA